MLLLACSPTEDIQEDTGITANNDLTEEADEILSWQEVELTNVLTEEQFSIQELQTENKVIFMETFAIWCPTCTKQQTAIQELHDILGEEIISVSLDVDPNEDAPAVKDHATSYGFDWNYAIAPVEMVQVLIDEFGVTIASAPLAPIIRICPNGEITLLKSGFKSVEELQTAVSECVVG